MKKKTRSIEKIIEEQVRRWEIMRAEKKKEEAYGISVITISREPGSGGGILAKGLTERLGLNLFHHEIIHRMAESSRVNSYILKTLDEKGLNVLEHLIASFINRQHLWPDQHLEKLIKIIATIGKQGRAIIVGRGANFIIPPEERFSLRIVASFEIRTENVSRHFGVSAEEAKRRILRTESDRRAFIRKYFYADIADPLNYDLLINTGMVSVDTAVDIICSALEKWDSGISTHHHHESGAF